MAALALGAVGGYFFGPLGFLVGSALGNMLFPQKQEGPRLTDLHTTTADYGTCIPRIWGRYRLPLIVIWADDLVEHKHKSGGKGGARLAQGPVLTVNGRSQRLGIRRDNSRGMKGGPNVTTYTYTVSFYGHFCEAPPEGMNSFLKLWIDKQLEVDVGQDNSAELPYTFFSGSSTQMPFSAAEAVLGAGLVPAYRGKCGMGFENLDVGTWGNRIPNVEAEVVESGGDIPWRVSNFDPQDGKLASAPMVATWDTDDQVVTVGWWSGGLRYYTNEWTIEGERLNSPFPTDHGVVDSIGGAAADNLSAQIANLQVALLWGNPGPGGRAGWYGGTELLVEVLANPAGGGVTRAAVGYGVYQDDFIYAPCDGPSFSPGGIGKWSAPNGVPDSSYPVGFLNLSAYGADGGNVTVAQGGEGVLYAACGTGIGALNVTLVKFDADLTILEVITSSETPDSFNEARPFVAYQGNLMWNYTGGGGNNTLDVYRKDGDDFTQAGSLSDGFYGSPLRFSRGYCIVNDGIVSLDPPPHATTLGRIVASISDICKQYSRDVDSLIDVVDGYCVSTQGSGIAAISPLQNAWPFDAVESSNGSGTPVFKFVRRGGLPVIDIPYGDLGAHTPDQEMPALCQPTRKLESELPRAVYTNFADIGADYQKGTQLEQRQVGAATSDITLELPIAMSNAYGKTVAGIYLYGAWLARTSFKFFTSVEYAWLEPTDLVMIGVYTMRLTKKVEHTTGVFEWEALQDDPGLWTRSFSGVSGVGNNTPVISGKVAASLVMLDLPLLDDDDSPNGVYADMWPVSETTHWAGRLYKSIDGGTTWDEVDGTSTQAVVGTCSNALTDWDGGYAFDETQALHVVLGPAGGTLSSVTRDEATAGMFRIRAGAEMLYARDATNTAPGEYDITGLIRGQRGTEWAMGTHRDGEDFGLLPPTMNPDLPFAELGYPVKFKGVTRGMSMASADAVDFTNRGMALKPWSPVLVGGGPLVNNDVAGFFTRRSRFGVSRVDSADPPLGETEEKYEVEFWDPTYTTCARTIETTTQTFLYTEAQQLTDFGALQSGYYVTVGMVGSYGIGTRAVDFIKGPGVTLNFPLTSVIPYDGTPLLPPPPPPPFGGGGSPPPLSGTFTVTAEIHPTLTAGNVYVYSFTTTVSHIGRIVQSEYGGTPATKHTYISTNGTPSGKVAGTEEYGTTTTAYLTSLAPSTTYYYVIDFKWPDGSWTETPGTSCPSLIRFEQT